MRDPGSRGRLFPFPRRHVAGTGARRSLGRRHGAGIAGRRRLAGHRHRAAGRDGPRAASRRRHGAGSPGPRRLAGHRHRAAGTGGQCSRRHRGPGTSAPRSLADHRCHDGGIPGCRPAPGRCGLSRGSPCPPYLARRRARCCGTGHLDRGSRVRPCSGRCPGSPRPGIRAPPAGGRIAARAAPRRSRDRRAGGLRTSQSVRQHRPGVPNRSQDARTSGPNPRPGQNRCCFRSLRDRCCLVLGRPRSRTGPAYLARSRPTGPSWHPAAWCHGQPWRRPRPTGQRCRPLSRRCRSRGRLAPGGTCPPTHPTLNCPHSRPPDPPLLRTSGHRLQHKRAEGHYLTVTALSGKMSGGVLLSHAVPRAVPSALKGLTSGFGMGPGVSPSPWPPKHYGDVANATAPPGGAGHADRISGTAQWTRIRSLRRSQATRPISTGQLHTLPCFHLRPINPVVYWGPYQVNPEGVLILRRASRLDAFSGYPFQT